MHSVSISRRRVGPRSSRPVTSRSPPIKTSCTCGLQFSSNRNGPVTAPFSVSRTRPSLPRMRCTRTRRLRSRRTLSQLRHCEELLRRSNPESFLGDTLDCFAALAMTEWRRRRTIQLTFQNTRHGAAASRRVSPELCLSLHPLGSEGAGKAGSRLAPAVHCARHARSKCTAAYR